MQDRETNKELAYALAFREIDPELDAVCERCGGSGVTVYGSTATWRGGIGGQAMTRGVCDGCWGSGLKDRPWPSHRLLVEKSTPAPAPLPTTEREQATEAFRRACDVRQRTCPHGFQRTPGAIINPRCISCVIEEAVDVLMRLSAPPAPLSAQPIEQGRNFGGSMASAEYTNKAGAASDKNLDAGFKAPIDPPKVPPISLQDQSSAPEWTCRTCGGDVLFCDCPSTPLSAQVTNPCNACGHDASEHNIVGATDCYAVMGDRVCQCRKFVDPPLSAQEPETKGCEDYAPAGFGGHWRDWHRGHGCNLDPSAVPSVPPTPDALEAAIQAVAGVEMNCPHCAQRSKIAESEIRRLLNAPKPTPDAVRTLRELEQQKRWADFLSEYVDFNHGSGISDTAWMEFMDKEHETLPVVRCLCSRCRAALAATEDAR